MFITRRPVGRESSAVKAQYIQFRGTSNNCGESKKKKKKRGKKKKKKERKERRKRKNWEKKNTNLIEGLYP